MESVLDAIYGVLRNLALAVVLLDPTITGIAVGLCVVVLALDGRRALFPPLRVSVLWRGAPVTRRQRAPVLLAASCAYVGAAACGVFDAKGEQVRLRWVGISTLAFGAVAAWRRGSVRSVPTSTSTSTSTSDRSPHDD